MTTPTLTPEQIDAGWKPIGEIVNEPDAGFFQILEPRLHSAFYAPNTLFCINLQTLLPYRHGVRAT